MSNQWASHLGKGRAIQGDYRLQTECSPGNQQDCDICWRWMGVWELHNLVNVYNIGFQFKLKFAIKLLRSFYHCLTHLKTLYQQQIFVIRTPPCAEGAMKWYNYYTLLTVQPVIFLFTKTSSLPPSLPPLGKVTRWLFVCTVQSISRNTRLCNHRGVT